MSQTASLHEANAHPDRPARELAPTLEPLIVSATPLALGLLILGALSYLLSPLLAVVLTLAAAVLVAARAALAHQVATDLADMRKARQAHARGEHPAESAEFVYLRSGELLARPKLLTTSALAQIQELNAWAKVEHEHG